MQTSLVGGELLGYFLRSLDHPEVEGLSLNHEVVAVTDLLLNLLDLIAGEARHDTVHEGSIHTASLLEPLLEVGTEVPQVDILIDTVLQHVTVQEDQLTGEDDQTLCGVAVEGLVTTIQQLYQFAGIRTGGSILQLTTGVEGDTCLSGVRDHETDLGLVGQCHKGGILGIGIQRTADHVDTLEGVHGLTVLTTLQVHMVQTILGIEPEEVTFTELNHLFRHHALRSKLFV